MKREADLVKRPAKCEVRDTRCALVRFLVFALFLSLSTLGFSASTPWQVNKHGQVRLLSSVDVAPTSGTVWLGLEQQPAPGWHVYWKNSGDAGYAPRLKWTDSKGIDVGPRSEVQGPTNIVHPKTKTGSLDLGPATPTLYWPAPTKFILPGDLVAYGYEQEVVYPIAAHVQPGAKTLHLVLDLDYLTCSEPCVPYRYTLTLDIPTAALSKYDAEAQTLIERFRTQVPSAAFSDDQIQNQARVERIGTAATDASGPAPGFLAMVFLASTLR